KVGKECCRLIAIPVLSLMRGASLRGALSSGSPARGSILAALVHVVAAILGIAIAKCVVFILAHAVGVSFRHEVGYRAVMLHYALDMLRDAIQRLCDRGAVGVADGAPRLADERGGMRHPLRCVAAALVIVVAVRRFIGVRAIRVVEAITIIV